MILWMVLFLHFPDVLRKFCFDFAFQILATVHFAGPSWLGRDKRTWEALKVLKTLYSSFQSACMFRMAHFELEDHVHVVVKWKPLPCALCTHFQSRMAVLHSPCTHFALVEVSAKDVDQQIKSKVSGLKPQQFVSLSRKMREGGKPEDPHHLICNNPTFSQPTFISVRSC